MADMMPKKSYDLTEITRLLLEMRENCIPKAGNAYEDPKRTEKYDALNAAIDLINNPSKLAQWISVKDRLPEPEREVLVVCRKRYGLLVVPAIYENGEVNTDDSNWHWYDCDFPYDEENDVYIIPEGWWENRHFNPEDTFNCPIDVPVTHWMPLPEPPKEE